MTLAVGFDRFRQVTIPNILTLGTGALFASWVLLAVVFKYTDKVFEALSSIEMFIVAGLGAMALYTIMSIIYKKNWNIRVHAPMLVILGGIAWLLNSYVFPKLGTGAVLSVLGTLQSVLP